MVLAIVCITFALVVLMGLWPSWKTRSKKENTFYMICICVSFVVLLLRSLEVSLPDPTQMLVRWIHAIGLDR